MLSFEQRHTLADSVIRLLETFRDDLFPGVATWESFALFLILHRIAHMNQLGRAANASALAWSTGIPRTTVRRRLAELRRTGIIEQRGSCYLLSATFMNHPHLLRGFKRRREMVRHLSKYLAETAS
jgi:DNA-binding IclR family transcriptional regulator